MVVTHITAQLGSRYRLDYEIAAGGVGEVWQAKDLVLGRTVAIKLLRPEYAQHPETRTRFRVEARHAASVTHTAIAQVFDYHEGDAQTRPFLVMELVEGPSLAEVLAGGPLDPERVMDIVAQAAAGLDAAHRAGLVHRDIKPANLLLSTDGTVKITDFGIAHAAGSAPVTRHGQVVGTPAYLAPERVAGQAAGPASDLYSLGIVAHECLTGVRPFTGTSVEIAVAHTQRALPPLPASVPGPVAAFIAELTTKDPAARPASARLVSARATQLRDSLAGYRTSTQSDHPAAARTMTGDAHPATLVHQWYPDHGDGWPSAARSRDRSWSRRRVALAVALASVAAGVIGWYASATTGAAAPPPAPAESHGTSSTPTVSMVTVDANALTGQPVDNVMATLSGYGLRPSVAWCPQGDHMPDPGTVVAVNPNGQVPAGSQVTVSAVQGDGGNGSNGFGGNGTSANCPNFGNGGGGGNGNGGGN